MALYALDAVEIFGKGVLKAEGVVVDKEGNVYGGGRNGVIYKVSPEGTVSELTTLPAGSLPNGITMDRNGDLVYCDLGKKAMMRVTPSGQVSMIADRVGMLPLTLPNFASYDADGNTARPSILRKRRFMFWKARAMTVYGSRSKKTAHLGNRSCMRRGSPLFRMGWRSTWKGISM